MKYTNKHNFPDFVVQWLQFDDYDYDANTISTTTLLKPARAFALERKHHEELEIDLSDVVASRYGTAIHDSVEKVNLKDCVQEERLKKTVLNRSITGKFDILHKIGDVWELIDVKSTSVWSHVYGSKEEDYIKQLSIYRWLANNNGYDVVLKAKIWMVFTDWSAAKAKQDSNYPQTRLIVKEIDLWGDDGTLKYIGERVKLFNETEKLPEVDMPFCSDKELWASEDVWAVMKAGRKSAVKLFKSEEDAKVFAGDKSPNHAVVLRPGKVKRCQYCTVRKFCSQYESLVLSGRSENHDE